MSSPSSPFFTRLALTRSVASALTNADDSVYAGVLEAIAYAESVLEDCVSVLCEANALLVLCREVGLVIRFSPRRERFYVVAFYFYEGDPSDPDGFALSPGPESNTLVDRVLTLVGMPLTSVAVEDSATASMRSKGPGNAASAVHLSPLASSWTDPALYARGSEARSSRLRILSQIVLRNSVSAPARSDELRALPPTVERSVDAKLYPSASRLDFLIASSDDTVRRAVVRAEASSRLPVR